MEVIYLQHLLIEYLERQFFENFQHEFHFCQREINYKAFVLAFFWRREIIRVRKTVFTMQK